MFVYIFECHVTGHFKYIKSFLRIKFNNIIIIVQIVYVSLISLMEG